jgi:peptidoglycan/xylan/chitin deacetylase (PgdA/CDA1 family)
MRILVFARAVAACFVLSLFAQPCLAPASAAAGPTVVTLTFDDGIGSQYAARSMFAAHGMHGTFYVNSGNVGANSYYMTWSQVDGLAADGNEIGGHTVNHQRLTSLTPDEQRHQICDDAATLRNRGYAITSFAYPYGAGTTDTNVRSLLQECGYDSARKVGGIRDASDCPECPPAETMPPGDPYVIRSNPYVTGPMTLAMLQGWVTQAENSGGGWVPLMFHDICDGCYDASVSQTTLSQFLDWLQQRAALGTVVKTMHEVIDGPPPPPPPPPTDTTPPTTSVFCNAALCSTGWYRAAPTISFSATDTGGTGVAGTHYTTDGSSPTLSSPLYLGPFPVAATTTVKYRSWDEAGNAEAVRSVTLKVDTASPSVAIASPVAGATVSGPKVTVTVNASDAESGVGSVDLYVDGVKNANDASAPYAFTWSARKGSGKHTLSAVATDVAGNKGTSAPVSVTVR